MQALADPAGERPALLCRDQVQGLRHLMRMAFANLVMLMADAVDSCRFDETTPGGDAPYDPDYPFTMEVELRDGVQPAPLMVKTAMEHIVALTTLSFVYDRIAPQLSRDYRRQALDAVSPLCDSLRSTLPVGRLTPWYY